MLDFNAQPPAAITIALQYAAAGVPVFPCNPLDKTPLTKHGFKDATTDVFKIRSWWTQWPLAMIGAPTGAKSGFWVLDVDNDPSREKYGFASLESIGHPIEEMDDHPTAKTAGGGQHVFFKHEDGAPHSNARGGLPPFLDVRSDGGYVIMPGSQRADGAKYEWLSPPDETPFSTAPEWLNTLILNQGRGEPLDFNTAHRQVSPAERVANAKPGTWHESTRDLVARMCREGASDETIAALAPRFTEAGFTHDQTVREFLTHARTARAKWGYQPKIVEPAQSAEEGSAQRFKILSIDELVNVSAPEWRIDGILPTHGASTLYGAFETFKSFIAVDMTLCLATGRPWQGRAVKSCPVLYIAGEGQTGLGMRVKGWLSAKGISPAEARFMALPEAVAIPAFGDVDDLLRAIEAMPEPPEVIVLDTVTRMTGGGSLNDEKDAQAYVRGMDRLRIATGAHIMNIGHSGKDKERGILGSIVLPAAMETIICVERKNDRITLINSNPKGKQKDGPNFEDVHLLTRKVEFAHQDSIQTTLILMPDDEVVQTEAEPAQRLGPIEQKILAALGQAASAGQGLRFMRLKLMCGDPQDSSLNKALKRLVEKSLISKAGEEYVLL